LVESGAVSNIDAIWASHYHDDHTASINAVRRKYDSKVYVQQELRDIFERPLAYSMPALFPESIHIDHALAEGEVIDWKGFKLTAYYFPGQTLYHGGLLIEYEGARVFMTGDSFANWGIDDYCSYNRNFLGTVGEDRGYYRCLRLLQKLNPDMLCAAHWGPEPVSQAYLQKTVDILKEREAMLTELFPWQDPNFGLDPAWIRAYPYRQSAIPGTEIFLEARIFNHSDSEQQVMAQLCAPLGFEVGKPHVSTVAPRSEVGIRLNAVTPKTPSRRRDVLGITVHFAQRTLAEFAEAILDHLEQE